MKRVITVASTAVLVASGAATSAQASPRNGRDRPRGFESIVRPLSLFRPFELSPDGSGPGNTGGQLSKVQIEAFPCSASGNPTAAVDISCNTPELGQDYAPDNEIAVAVDPTHPNHIVAGWNDYFCRFNNSTGARQAIVPTGFFTSFDGGGRGSTARSRCAAATAPAIPPPPSIASTAPS